MDMEKVIKGWECHMEADTLKCADCPYREGWRTCNFADTLFKDVYALLKEQEETKTIICQKCGDEIEIKWSLLIKPDIEAIAKRDAFLSDKNGKKLNDAMQSLWRED